MKGHHLKFFAYESQQHHGILLYDWLLEFAKKEGLLGGTVFRGVAGFGRQKNLHEEHFFELGADVPIEISFILPEEKTEIFLEKLEKENLDLFYVKIPVEYGSLSL